MNKKLSVAFIWHMHQPVYKDMTSEQYLMPWVRLHAIKDYLDMVLILEDFPEIKQTFNLVPALIDQLIDYGENEAHDIHSMLTVTDVKDLTAENKQYILEHFFDANYANMIMPHEPYKQLYEKRFNADKPTVEVFEDNEYSDLMAWFNLAWFDPIWFEKIPELQSIYEKGRNFTLDDRKQIIEIQRNIIRKIIPTYKSMLEKGQIEISTSPYYHPILPLLIDVRSSQRSVTDIQLPKAELDLMEDAKAQVSLAIKRFKDVFGKAPSGMWPSEQCISPEMIQVLSAAGIKWTITDEGILSKTLEKEFVRNFYGDLDDPYDLCRSYKVDIEGESVNVLFRNSVLADLIGFEYGNHDPETAANDLYERVKNIQAKLTSTPDRHHVVVIALDGENCWESYKHDGKPFLKALYTLLAEDNSLDVTTVKDYLKSVHKHPVLNTIHSGSWINRNFKLWVGDPTKNIAWDYLWNTRNDLIKLSTEKKIKKEDVKKAWREIFIAEGSDWFWWYGEPNDSGQDDLYDSLFRTHLQNVYRVLGQSVPEYLQIPIDQFIGKPSKTPQGFIHPVVNGQINSETEWSNAGCIEIPQGPVYQTDKILRRIFFGCDRDNVYFRFDLNKMDTIKSMNEIFLYFLTSDAFKSSSPIRIRNKATSIFPIQKYAYSYEIEIPVNNSKVQPLVLSEAIDDGLWKVKMHHNINFAHKSVLELAIPFDDLGVDYGQELYFTIMLSRSIILQDIIPQNALLVFKRVEI